MSANFGIPQKLTADNGPQFASSEFKNFCESEQIKITFTTPYFPAMNGEVERFNRNIKKRLQISHVEDTDWKRDLADYILSYNNTVHGTTGETPAKLMFGRKLRDKMPSLEFGVPNVLHEEVRDRDAMRKDKQKEYADMKRRAQPSEVDVGDIVMTKNVCKDSALTPNFGPEEFLVVEKVGPEVKLKSTRTSKEYRRHTSHTKPVKQFQAEEKGELQEEKETEKITEEPVVTTEESKPKRAKREVKKPESFKEYV